MFEVPLSPLRADTTYEAVNRPDTSVLTGNGLVVVPSQVLGSMGRSAARPPGSAHWMIWSPLGSSDRLGNPAPVTAMVCPSEKDPPEC